MAGEVEGRVKARASGCSWIIPAVDVSRKRRTLNLVGLPSLRIRAPEACTSKHLQTAEWRTPGRALDATDATEDAWQGATASRA